MKTGLVVLAYGTDGYVDNARGPWKTMMRGYADELAARGFVALIPDYFARTDSKDGGPAIEHIATKRSEARALVETVTHARTLPGVDPSRIEYEDATHGFAGPTAADTTAAADSNTTTLKFFQTRL